MESGPAELMGRDGEYARLFACTSYNGRAGRQQGADEPVAHEEDAMSSNPLEFVDTAAEFPRWDPLLQRFYHEVYLPAFPIEDEREELEAWRIRLRDPAGQGYETHPVLVGTGLSSEAPEILGGYVAEYYPCSNTALFTYVALRRGHGHRDLTAILTAHAIAMAEEAARRAGAGHVRACFAEMNDPEQTPDPRDPMDPRKRAALLSRLGFLVCGCPYLQPRLVGRSQRYTRLRLLVHRHTLNGKDTLSSALVHDFLVEFFTAVEGPQALGDPQVRDVLETIRSSTGVPLS